MICKSCLNIITSQNKLLCTSCKNIYHIECLNLNKEQFAALTREFIASWLCSECQNITLRSKPKPVSQHSLFGEESMNMSFDTTQDSHGPRLSTTPVISDVTMDNISALFDRKLKDSLSVFMGNFRSAIRDDIKQMVQNEVKSTVLELKNDLNDTSDYFNSQQLTLKSEIAKRDGVIKQLESDRTNLQNDIIRLNTRLTSIEKMSRSFNVELQAVPESRNENVVNIFKNLCDTIQFPIEGNNIHACRRISKVDPKSPRPRNILVTLATPLLKDSLLSAVNRYNKNNPKNPLSSSLIGMPGETHKIYVTEHNSPDCKMLHAATRKFAREKSYKYVWVKYGRVYIRKDDNANSIFIKNIDSLNNLNIKSSDT